MPSAMSMHISLNVCSSRVVAVQVRGAHCKASWQYWHMPERAGRLAVLPDCLAGVPVPSLAAVCSCCQQHVARRRALCKAVLQSSCGAECDE